ncbi:FecR domain-containing protein [Verrucomicrobiota bacterium sgz303538]
MASDEQLAAYLSGNLDPETRDRLEEELLSDPDSRAELLGQRRISAGLHALLGNSASMEQAIVATLRTTPEEIAIDRIVKATVDEARRPHPFAWREHVSFGWLRQLAAVLVAAALTAAALYLPRRMEPVAMLRDIAAADWKTGDPGKVGAALRPGWLELNDGLAEIEFRSGARVALQGPARFRLIDSNSMELSKGKLSADVPHQASGFTVQTNAGNVVDLGTKFGVNVHSEKLAEVHVLEGRVEVHHPKGTGRALSKGEAVALHVASEAGITDLNFAPEQFPRPSRTVAGMLVGGGFEEDTLVAIDYAPRQFNLWSGDPAFVVPASDGIVPRSGRQMLRFELPEQGKPVAGEQWQLVDLHALREESHNAPAEATLSVWFNRGTTATTRPTFGVTLAAFHGDPAQAPHFWAARQEKALALAEKTIRTDLDPATWERAEAHIAIPRDADFLLVQIAANQSREPESGDLGPSAHYADDATLEIQVAATTAASEDSK